LGLWLWLWAIVAPLHLTFEQGSVRATVVGRDVVLAGDPKVFRLLCNTNLNMNKVHVRYRVTWHASAALAEGRSEAMAGREW